MNIGICCYPSYGGSGVVATELGKHLAKRGHNVHFVSYDKPFRLAGFHKNIAFHSVESPNYPVFKHQPYIMALANKLAEVSEREELDILHAHYAVPHATAVYLANQMLGGRLKTVTTLHGTDVSILSEEPNLRQIMAYSVNQSHVVTAVSKSLSQQAKEALGEQKSIIMMHNFIDTTEYRRVRGSAVEDIKKGLGIRPEEKVVLHTSNFRKVKRIPDVIDVFKKISEKMPARLLLVGDGPEQRQAYEQVEKYGLLGNVDFLGNQDCVVQILSVADLFLLPSEKESFGLAALEAMACEVPVVASHAGGLPEVIEHGMSGWLSAVGDIEDMAQGAIHILCDKERHLKFSKEARKRAQEKFHVDPIVDQYEALYRSLLD